ncbi:MAG: response regulator [Clostridia bacterium]
MNIIKIILVDDQNLMSEGLQAILSLEDDLQVVAVAENGSQACELVRTHRPDVLLMDIRMPVMNGIEATKIIKSEFPSTIVIMLSTFAEDDYIIEALAFGATGFLLKDMKSHQLVTTIRQAVQGDYILPPMIAGKLAERLHQFSMGLTLELSKSHMKYNAHDLTDREKEIAQLILKGWNNRQIASALHMSEGTIRNYTSSIYTKLGSNDRARAIVLLRELFGET